MRSRILLKRRFLTIRKTKKTILASHKSDSDNATFQKKGPRSKGFPKNGTARRVGCSFLKETHTYGALFWAEQHCVGKNPRMDKYLHCGRGSLVRVFFFLGKFCLGLEQKNFIFVLVQTLFKILSRFLKWPISIRSIAKSKVILQKNQQMRALLKWAAEHQKILQKKHIRCQKKGYGWLPFHSCGENLGSASVVRVHVGFTLERISRFVLLVFVRASVLVFRLALG